MRAAIRTALITAIVTAAVVILLSGCGSGNGQAAAGTTASQRTTATAGRASSSPPAAQPTHTTTPITVKGEIRGTATDFCSAFMNFSKGTTKSRTFPEIVKVLMYAVADIRRFAPPSLERPVEHFTDDLNGISKDIQLLSIGTNSELAGAMQKVFTSPDGVTISNYLTPRCKK
jgi:hypothetical protein